MFSYQPPWTGTLATISTSAVNSIAGGNAVGGGNILSDGGAPILQKGICWSLNPHPTLSDSHTNDGNGMGSYMSSISNLNPSSQYYVRSFANNGNGTVYGNEVSFISGPLAIGQNYQGGIIAYILQPGDLGYDVNVQNGIIAAPSDQGFVSWGCYGAVINGADGTAINTGNQNTVDIINGCTEVGIAARICNDLVLNGYSDWYLPSRDELNQLYLNKTAIGGFASTNYLSSSEVSNNFVWVEHFLNGYEASNGGKQVAYYARAVRSFSVLNTIGVTTNIVSAVMQTTATCGGSVVSQGGSPVIARGVCWSTNPNPTVSLITKTIDGTGTGNYTSNISGLNPGTTYHVRAYATSSVGTVYGNDLIFTTAALAIGANYGGGKVAYLLQAGDSGYVQNEQHGLIAAPSDQGFSPWGCYGTSILGATGIALGTGSSNTAAIVASCSSSGIAAQICSDLVLNGYNDWYLPSKDELLKLYQVRASIGGFAYNYYWSSTQSDSYNSWELNFMDGLFYTYYKIGAPLVRAVRSF